jgi:hypothetical protein
LRRIHPLLAQDLSSLGNVGLIILRFFLSVLLVELSSWSSIDKSPLHQNSPAPPTVSLAAGELGCWFHSTGDGIDSLPMFKAMAAGFRDGSPFASFLLSLLLQPGSLLFISSVMIHPKVTITS